MGMGTRSIVAVPTGETSWKGRYVHWDGYPSGVGASLVEIIKRDGIEATVKTLTEDHWGWSIVDHEQPADLQNFLADDPRFKSVPGVGVPYRKDVDGGDQPDEWTTDVSVGTSWCEWVYVLMPDGKVKVYEIIGSRLTLRSSDLANDPVTED